MTEEKNTEAVEEVDDRISIQDFMKIELTVGKIMTCERIPKSKKLLKMEIDLGSEVRQILGGFAPYYLPEELLGRRVAVVSNLKPAKLMGIESQGMILAASPEYEGAVPVPLAIPEGMPVGTRIR